MYYVRHVFSKIQKLMSHIKQALAPLCLKLQHCVRLTGGDWQDTLVSHANMKLKGFGLASLSGAHRDHMPPQLITKQI